MQVRQQGQQGFTLVELAVVLTIIALLVGGILGGQAMIRASELKSIINDAQTYKTAIATFRDQYRAVPGDMHTAVRFWGAVAGPTTDGSNATCQGHTAPSLNKATCNGDGNGIIGNQGSPALAITEIWRAWQHLSNSGLIQGTYTGVSGSGMTFGRNVPGSAYNPNAGFTLYGVHTPTGYFFPAKYRNALFFGGKSGTGVTEIGMMPPTDAHYVDIKLDDGVPNAGKVLTFQNGRSGHPNCTSGDGRSYLLASSEKGCSLIFITGY